IGDDAAKLIVRSVLGHPSAEELEDLNVPGSLLPRGDLAEEIHEVGCPRRRCHRTEPHDRLPGKRSWGRFPRGGGWRRRVWGGRRPFDWRRARAAHEGQEQDRDQPSIHLTPRRVGNTHLSGVLLE